MITARALSLACSRSLSAPRVKLCVFDSIKTVAAYARAFRTCARSIHAETSKSYWISTEPLKGGVREFMASKRSERSKRVALAIACGEQPGERSPTGGPWTPRRQRPRKTRLP